MSSLARVVVASALALAWTTSAEAAPTEGDRAPEAPPAIDRLVGGTVPADQAFDQRPPLGLLPTPEDALIDPRMARSWGVAPSRLFVSSMVDVGFVYFRPRVSLGYGKPFTKWIGIDANPLAQTTGLGAYGGLRIEVPFVDLRLGPRYFRPFTHTYLAPHASYDRISLETSTDVVASIVTYEAEVDSSIPVGPGNVLLRGSASYITGVPKGKNVYEETLHIISTPPWVWRARGGYVLRLGRYSQHSIGLVADVLDVPKRDDSKSVRVGPVLRWVLSRRVEVRGSFILTVYSPDRIGLAGSDFTELGVRYRWATEPTEPAPEKASE